MFRYVAEDKKKANGNGRHPTFGVISNDLRLKAGAIETTTKHFTPTARSSLPIISSSASNIIANETCATCFSQKAETGMAKSPGSLGHRRI